MPKSFISQESLLRPDVLTAQDKELIISQCKDQGADAPEKIAHFMAAYTKAKTIALDNDRLKSLSADDIIELLMKLGELDEPKKCIRTADQFFEGKKHNFRRPPDNAANRGKDKSETGILPIPNSAKNTEEIIRSLTQQADFISEFLKAPESYSDDYDKLPEVFYAEFKRIHPFIAGNDHVGDLLWRILRTRVDGHWPKMLPPNIFDKRNTKRNKQTMTGNLEL